MRPSSRCLARCSRAWPRASTTTRCATTSRCSGGPTRSPRRESNGASRPGCTTIQATIYLRTITRFTITASRARACRSFRKEHKEQKEQKERERPGEVEADIEPENELEPTSSDRPSGIAIWVIGSAVTLALLVLAAMQYRTSQQLDLVRDTLETLEQGGATKLADKGPVLLEPGAFVELAHEGRAEPSKDATIRAIARRSERRRISPDGRLDRAARQTCRGCRVGGARWPLRHPHEWRTLSCEPHQLGARARGLRGQGPSQRRAARGPRVWRSPRSTFSLAIAIRARGDVPIAELVPNAAVDAQAARRARDRRNLRSRVDPAHERRSGRRGDAPRDRRARDRRLGLGAGLRTAAHARGSRRATRALRRVRRAIPRRRVRRGVCGDRLSVKAGGWEERRRGGGTAGRSSASPIRTRCTGRSGLRTRFLRHISARSPV